MIYRIGGRRRGKRGILDNDFDDFNDWRMGKGWGVTELLNLRN
jgi:hypothetical protein